MKRGKDDEKIMEPMFPRLHVNDTDKGGPRAPPRNKMALYEQLTIPSQRYNSPAAAPPRQNSTSNLVPSTSTSQGTCGKRKAYFSLYQPPSTPAYEEIQDLNTEAINLNNQPICVEEKKKSLEEDDFMVPIFSEGKTELHNENIQNSNDKEGSLFLNSNNQTAHPTTIREKTNQSHDDHLVLNQLIKDRDGRDSRASPSTRISLDISMCGRNGMPWLEDASLPEDHRGSSRAVDCRSDENVPDLRVENSCKDTSLRLKLDPETGREFRGDDEINRGIDSLDDDGYLEKESIKGDDVSETSMVDSASEFDITPDDVVDIIGRKHFWKARTAIVNQQRVFAVQVFELHRLLKVQKLIAGSPNLLLEVSAFEGKSPLKGSSVKYSSEYVVKALPHKAILKDVTHRTIDKVEGTAENAVPKAPPTPIAPQQHPNQPAGYPSFSGNMDPKVNPWGFHQPSPHQWLVPVMTPSEGLVYKPYPAPGFMGPVCGGYGPVGPTSIPSNLMNPPYVAQTQQYQQPMGMPPGVHFGGPGYFPPYGMHMMGPSMSGSTVDQVNPSFGSNPYSQGGQPESSPAARFGAPMPASAPTSDRATAPLSEGRDERRRFRSPPTSEAPMDTPPGEKQARVIRAVPHRSTNDSAARIFQSIQQERQLYETR